MTSEDFRARLVARASRADIVIAAGDLELLERYFQLLNAWNRKVNLTALPLDPVTDESLDRLFVEPLAAASRLNQLAGARWADLGSGGGSPAIPMKVTCPHLDLTMIESRSRKAAFLKEVVRTLHLANVVVENLRFEEFHNGAGQFDLITVRAVRIDSALRQTAWKLLRDGGLLALFTHDGDAAPPDRFRTVELTRLTAQPKSYLYLLEFVPRGTNRLTET